MLHPTLARKAANNLLIPFQRISVFYKIKFWNHNTFQYEDGADTLDTVHVRNTQKDCQGHVVPSCFDTMLIDNESAGPHDIIGMSIYIPKK